MTTNEKLNYIISVLTEIVSNSKDIGGLEIYVPNDDESENLVAVYSTIDGKTRRANINELFELVTGSVPTHTHEFNEINGLGEYKTITLQDSNGLDWKVQRLMEAADSELFNINDEIKGFTDIGKTEYYHGIVLQNNINVPADLNDTNKFFKLQKLFRI